jgi:hypothetical protein
MHAGAKVMTPSDIAREIDRAALQKFYAMQFQRRRRGERCRDAFDIVGVMIAGLAIWLVFVRWIL